MSEQRLRLEDHSVPIFGPPTSSYVYAIRAGEFVKVGKADRPYKRIHGFRTGCPHPIEVLTTIEFVSATSALEAESLLHRMLDDAGLHYRGEWFRWTPLLEAHLLSLGAEIEWGGELPDEESRWYFKGYAEDYIARSFGHDQPGTIVGEIHVDTVRPWKYGGIPILLKGRGVAGNNYGDMGRDGCPPATVGPLFLNWSNGELWLYGMYVEDDLLTYVHTTAGDMVVLRNDHQVRIASLIDMSISEGQLS